LDFLIKNIMLSDVFGESKFFIVGFDHLSIQRGVVIEELLKKSKSICFGVRDDSELKQFVEEKAFELGITPSAPYDCVDVATFEGETVLLGFESVYEEASWVCNKICGLVNKDDARYGDIVVCLSDFENDVKIYQQILVESGITVNVDVGVSLLECVLTQCLRQYLLLALNGRAESLISIIKSPFFRVQDVNGYRGLGIEEEFELENLILRNNLRTLDGVGEFVSGLKKCVIADDYITILREILQRACGEDKENDGFDNVVEGKIVELLDTVERCFGGESVSIDEFLNLFCTLAGATKVSRVPEFADAVTLVDINEHQPFRTKYLFITGASEDVLPARQDDTDIITTQDIENRACRMARSIYC